MNGAKLIFLFIIIFFFFFFFFFFLWNQFYGLFISLVYRVVRTTVLDSDDAQFQNWWPAYEVR